jgi:hypothetical protein
MDVALGNPIDLGRAAVSRDPDENLTGIRGVLQTGVPMETQLRIRVEIRVRTLTTQVGILETTQALSDLPILSLTSLAIFSSSIRENTALGRAANMKNALVPASRSCVASSRVLFHFHLII